MKHFTAAALVFGLGCVLHTGQKPAAASGAREVRVTQDYGLGGPGPLLLVTVAPGGQVRGAMFVRAPRPIAGLPDSLTKLLQAQREATFTRVGCNEPVEMDFALACRVRFRGREPDWVAVLRVLDAALAADSATERADTLARPPAVQPDGTIRIRGCHDCWGVAAEIREEGRTRRWALGPEAAAQLGRLADSLVSGRPPGR